MWSTIAHIKTQCVLIKAISLLSAVLACLGIRSLQYSSPCAMTLSFIAGITCGMLGLVVSRWWLQHSLLKLHEELEERRRILDQWVEKELEEPEDRRRDLDQ